jgi:trk system potassium uptake protein
MKQFAIIGMSNFGKFMLDEFENYDCEILVIDKKRELVESIKDRVTSAYIADAMNEETINRLVPESIDAAIIDLGDSIEVSILTANYLKKMGVKQLIAKAESAQHGEILKIIGVDIVVFPNREAAKRLAPMIASDALFGYFPIAEDLIIAEVKAPAKLAGKTVVEADLRRKSGLNIIALKHDESYQHLVSGDYAFTEGEILLVSGSPDDISRFTGDKLPEKEGKRKGSGLKRFF